MNRLAQFVLEARQRMVALPAAFSLAAVLAAIGFVWLDRQVATESLPQVFQTSVDGGREVLGTIAMGLIAAYTLLLSLMLIAVQLASSQFSPRTLRNWLGDSILHRAIGLVLATVVFCLLVLYQTRDLDDADTFEPNLSVFTAIVLALASLIVVLRSVDHLADSMRVGSVAKKVMGETLELIDKMDGDHPIERPKLSPAPQLVPSAPQRPPGDVHVVAAESAGWIQHIDIDDILDACDEGVTVHLPAAVGVFTLSGMPLAWISPIPDDPEGLDEFDTKIRTAISIGEVRTMQQDIGYGLTRLVDVALRALSPSLNDANTAKDIIAHLGEVVLALLARPERSGTIHRDGRTLVAAEHSHRKYVLAAFDQIRHSALDAPEVLANLVQTLLTIRDEVTRRELPADTTVLDDVIVEIVSDVERSQLSPRERRRILDLVPVALRI
jgi:uncharacterized membrane protein